MNVHRALLEVAEIRAQLDRTASYRGFRSLATGFSAFFVLLGALIQDSWLESSSFQFGSYLSIWLGVAIASSVLAGLEMIVRGIYSGNRHVWITHRKLISNLMPSLLVGSVLTWVLASYSMSQSTQSSAAGIMWALPGMWAMLFGLGLFACRTELPSAARKVAAYYVVAGMACLLIESQLIGQPAGSTHLISSWQMIALFGLGQSFLGLVLYWNVERRDG